MSGLHNFVSTWNLHKILFVVDIWFNNKKCWLVFNLQSVGQKLTSKFLNHLNLIQGLHFLNHLPKPKNKLFWKKEDLLVLFIAGKQTSIINFFFYFQSRSQGFKVIILSIIWPNFFLVWNQNDSLIGY